MSLKMKKSTVIIQEENKDSSLSEAESEDSISDSHSYSGKTTEDSENVLNSGWADSIAKILTTNKPKKKKSLVLSKAKKLTDPIKKVQTEDYEIATADGQIRKEQTIVTQAIQDEPPRKKKRELSNLRVKPNILEKDRERTLQKIATRGVVQLFNAVRTQQKDISKKLDEAGPLEVRKEKVLKNIDKRAFLDLLMGEKSKDVDEESTQNKKHAFNTKQEKEQSWNVLRDDFLLSAKIKDWDKELENQESDKEMEVEEEIESD